MSALSLAPALTMALVVPVCLGFVVFTALKYILGEVPYTPVMVSGACISFGWWNFLELNEEISQSPGGNFLQSKREISWKAIGEFLESKDKPS